MIMSLEQRKIKIKPKKKFNHDIYTRNWIYYKKNCIPAETHERTLQIWRAKFTTQKNDARGKMVSWFFKIVSPNILRVAWEWQRRIYLGSCSPRKSRFTCPRTCHDWGVVVVMAGGHPPISSEVHSLCITVKNLWQKIEQNVEQILSSPS